jgi:intracellular sulfur oxidation DsrE/DsrF family protein
MLRRNLFRGALAAAAGAFTLSARAEAPARQRVAYHLSDLDKVSFVLGNLRNHINATGGPGGADLVLVVHGPALDAFTRKAAKPELTSKLAEMSQAGVQLNACGNTMRAMQLEVSDLLPGFVRVDQGGVVRLTELQMQGYSYLRP